MRGSSGASLLVFPNHARVCRDHVPHSLARPRLPVASAVNLDWGCGLDGGLWERAMSASMEPLTGERLARSRCTPAVSYLSVGFSTRSVKGASGVAALHPCATAAIPPATRTRGGPRHY